MSGRPCTYVVPRRFVRLVAMLVTRPEGVAFGDVAVSEVTWRRYVAALTAEFGASLERDGHWVRLRPGWDRAFREGRCA